MSGLKCKPGCECKRHSRKGAPRSPETIEKIRAAKLGHPVSEETRRKIGAASRGRTASEETKKKMSQAQTRHGYARAGEARSPEYRSWDAMKQRCYNPKANRYADYGGRGITVCDRWKNSFENFILDMGEKPEPKSRYSIDRVDNDGDYEPGNCRWATRSEQQRNRPNFNPNKRG